MEGGGLIIFGMAIARGDAVIQTQVTALSHACYFLILAARK